MKRPKTISVLMRVQYVDSDGDPVNAHGEAFGRGYKTFIGTEKLRRSADMFCPEDVDAGKRVAIYSNAGFAMVKCRCHGKFRLRKAAR